MSSTTETTSAGPRVKTAGKAKKRKSTLEPGQATPLVKVVLFLICLLWMIPAFGLLAALFFTLAARTYEADIHQVEDVHVEVDRSGSVAQPA